MSKSVFNLKKLALVIAVAASMSGCATEVSKQAEGDFKAQARAASTLAERAQVKVPTNPLFSKQAGFWVDKTPLPVAADPTAELPPVFKKPANMNQQNSQPLQEVFNRLNRTTGLMFTVAQDVYEADSSRIGANLSAASNTDSASKGAPAGGAGAAAAPKGGRVDVIVSDFNYSGGNLAGLLDSLATKTNLAWRYDGERVHFFRYDTRIFRIDALAGMTKSEATVSSTGSAKNATGGGSGASSGASQSTSTSQSTEMKTFADVWGDVSASLQAQLSARGKMSMMPSTGQVTVTDTPDQLRRIQQYVADLNKGLGKQVSFNVDVYAVDVDDQDSLGLDWSLVWQSVSSKYGLGLTSAGNTGAGQGLFALNLLNSANGQNSNFNGSKAVFGALSSLGRTSLVTSTSVLTLNNMTTPVAVTRETAFVESQETTVSGTAGVSQTSLKPGLITTGFNMNLTPRLTESDNMIIQFSMDLSDLIGIKTFSSPDGKAAIQLPERNVRNFLQRVAMRSGQTLILSGFQQRRTDLTSSGIGDASNWALGGKKNSGGKNTTLVIMITPHIMAR